MWVFGLETTSNQAFTRLLAATITLWMPTSLRVARFPLVLGQQSDSHLIKFLSLTPS